VSSPAHRNGGPKTRILLVDDSEVFLRVATDFLARHSELAVVGATQRGGEALTLAQDLQPGVVLIDMDMPGLGGLETIRRLRAALPSVGIIVLTLLDGDIYRQAALAAGADGSVPKATLTTDLLPAIRQVVQASGHQDEHRVYRGS
jgi:DNA-binding NarL/FixJ family response regulator